MSLYGEGDPDEAPPAAYNPLSITTQSLTFIIASKRHTDMLMAHPTLIAPPMRTEEVTMSTLTLMEEEEEEEKEEGEEDYTTQR